MRVQEPVNFLHLTDVFKECHVVANTTLCLAVEFPSSPPWLWMGDISWLRLSNMRYKPILPRNPYKPILPRKANSPTASFITVFPTSFLILI